MHPLYKARPTFYISYYKLIRLIVALNSTVHNKQFGGRGREQARKCENQGAWGKETHTQIERQIRAESIFYLNQSISWCSCLLLWSLRIKTWCSSHCWGTQWTSITIPCECCWGTSLCTSLFLFQSLDLPCTSSLLDDYSCGSSNFSEMMLI